MVEILEIHRKSESWLKSWKFIGRVSHRVKYSFPFLDGFIITVRSIKTVVIELLTTEHYNILTSRFNQDALENFFSQIRSKGGNRAIHLHQSMKPHAKIIIIIIIIIISLTSIFFQDESRVWTAASQQH